MKDRQFREKWHRLFDIFYSIAESSGKIDYAKRIERFTSRYTNKKIDALELSLAIEACMQMAMEFVNVK